MPPSPLHSSNLTIEQRKWLDCLWITSNRELVDVRPTNENKLRIEDDCLQMILRLHKFLKAVCLRALQQANLRAEQQPTVVFQEYIKHPESTCLRDFLAHAITGLTFADEEQRPPDDAAEEQEPVTKAVAIRLIPAGRRVFSFSHQEFIEEMNEFEMRGAATTNKQKKDSFGTNLYHKTEKMLLALGTALAFTTITLAFEWPLQTDGSSSPKTGPPKNAEIFKFADATKYIVRFFNVTPSIPMMNVKTSLLGKLVSIKGHIVKARAKRLRLSSGDFTCKKCGAEIVHSFKMGRYSVPPSCPSENCASRSFSFDSSTAKYLNMQELRLQESQDESTAHAGRAPRQLQIEVDQDLVETCRPGDIVKVACNIAAVNTALQKGKRGGGKKNETSTSYELYLIGHSISTLSETQQKGKRRRVLFTRDQLQRITELCHADHRHFGFAERRAFPFDLLVRSFCPAIIGHNDVKAGLLLCLLGGTHSPDAGTASIRENSHILICGDPGLGKSQMLLAASQLAARSVYVGGNTSTTTGLTVTLGKEESTGEASIEAGALVLADQGICCIDEFDKMSKSHQDGLLEAMEQQQVSIAKAGVVASLPARCSLIAAANPRQGTYNKDRSVSENLNMAKPILSRFDLVFILRDSANSSLDRQVAGNIMNLYRKAPSHDISTQQAQSGTTPSNGEYRSAEDRIPLMERLEWVNQNQKQPLPADLVRDYIAYAREYCKPKLTPESAAVLKEFFMKLRYPDTVQNVTQRQADTVPITTRQLEALIRLCQARAKACLRDFCLKEDALDVVELMSRSVSQVHSDEHGGVHRNRGGAGGASKKKMKKAFLAELHRMVGVGCDVTVDDLRRIAENVGVGLTEFHDVIEELRASGNLLKKSSNIYRISAC